MKTKTDEKHDFSAQFTTEPVACENLLREGTGSEKIHIAGHDLAQSLAGVDDVLNHGGKRVRLPELWGGKAAGRIKQILNDWLQQHRAPMVATG